MIIPMKKYSFLIHHADFEPFLEELQKLGVLDVIDRKAAPDEETSQRIQRSEQIKKAVRFLKSKAVKDSPEKTARRAGEILDEVMHLQTEIESARQKITGLEKTVHFLKPWGEFSKSLIAKLFNQGLQVRFFVVSDKKFDPDWSSEYYLEEISRGEGQVYFVIFQQEGSTIDIEAEEVKVPVRDAGEVMEEIRTLEERIREIEDFFAENARAFIPVLEAEKLRIDDKVAFDLAVGNTAREADERLMILEGWVPVERMKELDSFLDGQGVYFLTADPGPGEKVPVLLKNGPFSRLFEPIGKLYSLPEYGELDLTPFFAPFFMLFFGFCLSDAGYGLLFLILATLFKRKVSPSIRPILTLMQWLGGSTVVFGALTGTFFGINLIEVIDRGGLTWLSHLRGYMLESVKMFYFALILGGIQIIYGMVIKVVNIKKQNGIRYAWSTIGWIILILGSLAYYLLGSGSGNENGMPDILFYALLAVSGFMILFLNNPGKNVLVNFGGGLWSVYSIVTGVLGDLLSYIRLFALGVSSAILGYVFNDLAVQISGSLPVVSQLIFIIILLIGHGLNIFMASLGAFVHPMRLTFVEFYKNAGFSGGGLGYDPLRKKETQKG
jgi:V/A-type H+-transporting ATPase subunit I